MIKTINVNISKKYPVMIGKDFLNKCGEITAEIKPACNVALVSDDAVYPIYGDIVKESYIKAGFNVETFILKNGERNKTFEALLGIIDFFAAGTLSRKGLAVVLGGGVVGDIVGFAAAIYLRGVDYISIPTTLLAAIDSSVGGKTGVNLKTGKNLLGAFHQPLAVFCDTETFKTLPAEIFADGICEAIKYGCIADKDLFDTLLFDGIEDHLENIIEKCVMIKRDIVQADEFDRNERMLLNFGHTAGHAIELLSGYEISHGRAVAIGMHIMAECTDKRLISNVFQKYGVDISCAYSANQLAKAALSDKKRGGMDISVILLEKIGKAYLKRINVGELEGLFERGLNI